MQRWLKISLKIGGIILALFLLLWIVVAAYVYTHKKELLLTISSQLNENLNGKLSIQRMEPSLIRGFPGISVALENVLLRDSLWYKHKHDLLRAKNVYIAINAFSILTGSPSIKDIRIKNGEIYLFTDTNGVRNTDIFKKRTAEGKKGEGTNKKINRVYLSNVRLTIDDKLKNKRFEFSIENFLGSIHYNNTGWKAHVELQTRVDFFAFNIKRGSFMKNKDLDLDMDMSYQYDKEQLNIPLQKISIGDDDLKVSGKFNFATDNTDYQIEIKAPSIFFKDARALLSSHIISKLKPYDIKDRFDIEASLKGKFRQTGDPLINVSWKTENNIISTAGESITDCSFTGSYSNEWIKGGPRRDPNSVIAFYNMTGKYYDIPFKADSIRITDLNDPVFTGKFKADFPLSKLNKVFGANTFLFNSGEANLNLVYKAPFNQSDRGQRYIYGTIHVTGASATYKPRNLALRDMQVLMNFRGDDLYLQNLKVKSGTASLTMDGALRNFSNLYYTDPQKILIDWKIKSPQVNLNEFLVFLGKRKSGPVSSEASDKTVQQMSGKLEKMLEQASMNMNLSVDRLIYKKFLATELKSNITLNQRGIEIKDLSLRQGGGTLNITGNIDQTGKLNRFNVDTKIINVNVEKLFYAFENFGQNAITDKNLRGTFFGGTSISGSMYDNGKIVPRSFRGSVNFDIRNGALVNFEPMTKVGAFAFPNRNFSDIRFTNLKNTLNIQGNKVIIPPMEIRSSVLNIFLEGVYSFTTGTNIAIKIPLRNPQKDQLTLESDLKRERELKGIVINLRAIDGENGNVRFRLGKNAPEGYE